MNLVTHFGLYRASVMKDALESYVEFAKSTSTKNPQRFPTVYDYIKHVLHCIQGAIERGDEAAYKELVTNHQEAMVALFEKMVADLYGTIPQADWCVRVLDSPNWYKFSNVVITFDKLLWIPRYCRKYEKSMLSEQPCFSADEVKVIKSYAPLEGAESIEDKILDKKKAQRGLVLVNMTESGEPVFCTLDMMNTPTRVNDWSMGLFQ